MMKERPLAVIACTVLTCAASLIGCQRDDGNTTEARRTFGTYAALPGLQATHHRELQAEHALLVAERATPALLDEDAHASRDGAAAVDLSEVLTRAFNRSAVEFAALRADKLIDGDRLRWDPVNLQRAFQLRQQYDASRNEVRTACRQAGAYLSVELSQGVGLDAAFTDAARVYNRLELFYAAEQLTGGDIDGALQTLESMLTLCHLLDAPPLVVARLSAARSRREAWSLAQAMTLHSSITATQLEQLRQLVAGQLATWPRDHVAWIGDRAQGLHMYEMLRDGHLMSLLTEEEFAEHRKNRSLEAFAAAAMGNIDSDQYFYLRSMRTLIDDCDKPFHEREATFDALRLQLGQMQASPDYPLIADRLLLSGIEEAHIRLALDRAWIEAWANGLALAIEERAPPYEINPLTGRPYQIVFESGKVTISRIDPEDIEARVIVPIRRTERASRGQSLPPPG